jgi:hypothetical protein
MNACNLRQMYAFLTDEWQQALVAVQGFDFEKGAASISGGASAASSTALATPSITLDPLILSNAWTVMHSNVGMSWSEFADFLRLHAARFERMKSPSNGGSSEFTPPREVIDFSLDQIRTIQGLMDQDDIDTLIATRQQGALDGQLQLLSLHADDSKNVAADEDEDSETEFFPPRRNQEGRKRRTRIIRDDDEEVDDSWDEAPLPQPVESEEDLESEVLQPGAEGSSLELMSVSVASSAETAQQAISAESPADDIPSHESVPALAPLLSAVPIAPLPVESPVLGAAPFQSITSASFSSGAVDASSEVVEYQPEQMLNVLLKFVFQEFHAVMDLPFIDSHILSLISGYAAPRSSLSVRAPSSSRGPFFVVLTHYANGDTFSEEYSNEAELMDGVAEYTRGCRSRVREVERDSQEQQAEVMEQIHQLDAALAAYRADGAANSSCHSLHTRRQQLDDLLQLALTVGDDMISGQFGYGWTHVHECNEKHS